MSALFRREAVEARQFSGFGHVVLRQPRAFGAWSAIAVVLAAAVIALLVFGQYTKRVRVHGVTVPAAGVLKLVEGPGWTRQAGDMDVPRPLALVVPYVEIVVGLLLVVQVLEPWPAVAAIGLLVAFTVVIVRRLLDGSRPPCSCFGSRSKRPLGLYHVVRNVLFLGLAVVAIATA